MAKKAAITPGANGGTVVTYRHQTKDAEGKPVVRTYVVEVVAEATVREGLRRFKITADEEQAEVERREAAVAAGVPYVPDEVARAAASFTYPNLVAASVRGEGFDTWPPTLDEFLRLPERLWEKWREAVFTACPHWFGPTEDLDPKEPSDSMAS